MLIKMAEQNADRSIFGRRYDHSIKQFSVYLYIIGGRQTYETLQVNLEAMIPSVSLVVGEVRKVNDPAIEGEVRTKELKQYLTERHLGNAVFISEDATRLVNRVEFDSRANKCVGFVGRLDRHGLPELAVFTASTAAAIQHMFDAYPAAKYVYVVMAQPLQKNTPAFCLVIFGTDNKFTAQDVLNRWLFMKKKAVADGICIVGFAADGDSRLLSAMRLSSFVAHPACPEAWQGWFGQDIQSEFLYFQDTVHIGAKLRCRLLKPSILMPMGQYVVSITHLQHLLKDKTITKLDHGLTQSDLDRGDKQNFRAVLRMTSESARSFVRQQDDAAATEMYLQMTRDVIDAFLDPELSAEKRIFLIWRSTFFLRVWLLWLEEEGFTMADNFVSWNSFACIELNAHGLVKAVRRMRDERTPQLLHTSLFGSQACEGFFRAARSETETKSTVINFSMKEFLRRRGRIELQSMIAFELQDQFKFPRESRRQAEGQRLCQEMEQTVLPSDAEILAAIKEARESALDTARYLGMEPEGVPDFPACLATDRIQAHIPIDSDDEEDEQEDQPHAAPDALQLMDVGVLNSAAAEGPAEAPEQVEEPPALAPNSPFVRYTNSNGVTVVIRKSTLCWLYGDSERLSSDRLLRVQESGTSQAPAAPNLGVRQMERIAVDDWCVFRRTGHAADGNLVGRVLAFRYLTGRTDTDRQYTLPDAPVAPPAGVRPRGLGVLCSWFELGADGALKYVIDSCAFKPIELYKFTLPNPVSKGSRLTYEGITAAAIRL